MNLPSHVNVFILRSSKPYTNHTLSLVRPVNSTVGRVLPLSLFRFHSCSCPLSHLRCCPCFRSRSRRRLCSRPSLVPPLPSALPISVPVPVTVFAPSPSPSLFPFAPSRHASDLVPPVGIMRVHGHRVLGTDSWLPASVNACLQR